MELFGIGLVGVNAETGQKLLLTISIVLGILLLRAAVVAMARASRPGSTRTNV